MKPEYTMLAQPLFSPVPGSAMTELSRKRSASTQRPDEAYENDSSGQLSPPIGLPSEGAYLETSNFAWKRTKSGNGEEGLEIIPVERAWKVDIRDFFPQEESTGAPIANVFGKPERTLYVVAVVGALSVHYDILCTLIPSLRSVNRNISLYALALVPPEPTPHCLPPPGISSILSDPATLPPPQSVNQTYRDANSSSFANINTIPVLPASGPPQNHFLKLGLLHPLGGGQCPLDAVVVLDSAGRRRLVIPFGWGPGKHVAGVGGQVIRERLVGAIQKGIAQLGKEMGV